MEFTLREGALLPSFVRQVSQADINRYADASGDYNPIHIDEAFAASTPLKGTITHGMLVLAFMSEMLTRAFGPAWDETGRLAVKFRNPTQDRRRVSASQT